MEDARGRMTDWGDVQEADPAADEEDAPIEELYEDIVSVVVELVTVGDDVAAELAVEKGWKRSLAALELAKEDEDATERLSDGAGTVTSGTYTAQPSTSDPPLSPHSVRLSRASKAELSVLNWPPLSLQNANLSNVVSKPALRHTRAFESAPSALVHSSGVTSPQTTCAGALLFSSLS